MSKVKVALIHDEQSIPDIIIDSFDSSVTELNKYEGKNFDSVTLTKILSHDLLIFFNKNNDDQIINNFGEIKNKFKVIFTDSRHPNFHRLVERAYQSGFSDVFSINDSIEFSLQKIKHILHLAQVRETENCSNQNIDDKNNLVSIVSHDLKTPLGFINASAELIIDTDKNLSKETKELCLKIKEVSDYSISLISDLLDIGKLTNDSSTLDKEDFDILKLTKSVSETSGFLANKKNVSISTKVLHQCINVYADYGRIFQLISNLLSNAIKYSPENGEISIEITKKNENRSNNKNKEFLNILIKDRGRGIPQDKLESIFESFSQVNSDDKKMGHGLGLAICKKICELHGGSISAKSQGLNEGSTFEINLPIVQNIKKESSSIQKILVCDDHEDVCILLKENLESLGYEVEIAIGGKEGLEKLSSNKFDLTFLDYQMPELNGIEILKEVKGNPNFKQTPIIIVTNDITPSNLKEIGRYASELIYKPVEKDQLKDIIQKYQDIISKSPSINTYEQSILIVDDLLQERELLKKVIKRDDCKFYTAKNGYEALFMIKKYSPNIVISDIKMPGMSGIEMAKILRKQKNETPIIFTSSVESEVLNKVLDQISFAKALSKPIKFKVLNEEIDHFMNLNISQGDNIKILVVDDSNETLLLVRKLLKDDFIEISEAFSTTSAISLSYQNNYDIVLLDSSLGNESGIDIVKKLRSIDEEKNHQTKILGFTASIKDREKFMTIGCNGIIDKPLQIKTFKNDVLSFLKSALKKEA